MSDPSAGSNLPFNPVPIQFWWDPQGYMKPEIRAWLENLLERVGGPSGTGTTILNTNNITEIGIIQDTAEQFGDLENRVDHLENQDMFSLVIQALEMTSNNTNGADPMAYICLGVS